MNTPAKYHQKKLNWKWWGHTWSIMEVAMMALPNEWQKLTTNYNRNLHEKSWFQPQQTCPAWSTTYKVYAGNLHKHSVSQLQAASVEVYLSSSNLVFFFLERRIDDVIKHVTKNLHTSERRHSDVCMRFAHSKSNNFMRVGENRVNHLISVEMNHDTNQFQSLTSEKSNTNPFYRFTVLG